ncbi:hypothetical protein [Streptomyces sp. NBC_01257]|uniref:hypothetical protein n=1 Tax=Streptomyces sp. NBC_01257 TaxID=2903799 RepID=UPI002DD9C225|nr:hypothetical protein [Streptomyces sp. NBC_01257]WRZ67988.1 hypothetical protein OG408_30715 [Streptomyces sp. NBC_01257]
MVPEPPPGPAVTSYDGDGLTVEYDVHRELHAAECVRGAPAASGARRPGVPYGDTPAATVGEAARHCSRPATDRTARQRARRAGRVKRGWGYICI